MFDTKRFLATAAVVLAGVGSPAAWASLVVNGDFETDPVGNGGLGNGPPPGLGFDYLPSLSGWSVSHPGSLGVVLFDALYRPIGGGAQSLQLERPGHYIEQSIATTIGQIYMLSFDLASFTPPGISSLSVEIGSDPALLFGDVGGGGYTTHSVQFVATTASTLLHFESAVVPGFTPATYPHLDDISLVAVPEPASITLVGVAMVGLAVARRKKA